MLKITEGALTRIVYAKAAEALDDSYLIRVSVSGGGCAGMQYGLAFDNEIDAEEDIVDKFEIDGKSVSVVTDSFSKLYMDNVTIDYVAEDLQEGFKFTGGSANRRQCACGSSFSE